MKKCLVLGVGFIGWHLAKRLKEEGNYVVGVDVKFPEFNRFVGDHFLIKDLRIKENVEEVMGQEYDEVYTLAADMGGAGFVFTGEHDHEIITGNALINIYTALNAHRVGRVFFSSSACVYSPELRFRDDFREESAYPANPDSDYGVEKLFSERVYLAQKKAIVRIARYHNIFGPCYDEETEVLTRDGWKFFKDVKSSDEFATRDSDGTMLYMRAKEKQEYHYTGKMYKLESSAASQLVTPDHNLYVSRKTTAKNSVGKFVSVDTPFELIRACELTWDSSRIRFTSKFNWIGEKLPEEYTIQEVRMSDGRKKHPQKKVSMGDWFELVGWYVSEGSSFVTPSNYTVCITQYMGSERNRIMDLLKNMGIHYSEDKMKTQIIISNKQIYESLKGCGVGARNKRIPKWMLFAKKEVLFRLYESLMLGDGTDDKRYSTVSPELKDGFMELALKLGYAVNCSKENNKHGGTYRISLCKRESHVTKRSSRSIVEYNGIVYDVTLPKHHLLLIRRNGKVCWSGNCGSWCGGREKAPAAMCRKVAEAEDGGEVEIWGDGGQERTFLYIDDCLDATIALMRSPHTGPLNIGSEEVVSIDGLADIVADIAGKKLSKKHIPGPVGVNRRTSNNDRITEILDWKPKLTLREGLEKTYQWVEHMVKLNGGMVPENMK